MSEFSGYCVGGPYAGRKTTHNTRTLTIVECPKPVLKTGGKVVVDYMIKKYHFINGSWIWEDYLDFRVDGPT